MTTWGFATFEDGAVPRYLIDAYDLGLNTKGIHRVMHSLIPEMLAIENQCVIATTAAGADVLDGSGCEVLVVQQMRKSWWEQWGLPQAARRAHCVATYSHREAGALWGAPLVLHVPEDPEVRWAREHVVGFSARARRTYSRALMGRSLRRAAVAAASVPSVGHALAARYGVPAVATIPLGVDTATFTPAVSPAEDRVFHLGSPDPRDRTQLVVEAYAAATRHVLLPRLVVGGSLGDEVGEAVAQAVEDLGLGNAVDVTGRLSDEELADHYRHALCVVQPAQDEGFGLQPLEALSSGAPLIVSDTGAVRDVVGDAAVITDRTGVELVGDIRRVAENAQLRLELRQRGPHLALAYTWQATARAVLDQLRVAAERR